MHFSDASLSVATKRPLLREALPWTYARPLPDGVGRMYAMRTGCLGLVVLADIPSGEIKSRLTDLFHACMAVPEARVLAESPLNDPSRVWLKQEEFPRQALNPSISFGHKIMAVSVFATRRLGVRDSTTSLVVSWATLLVLLVGLILLARWWLRRKTIPQ